MSSSRGTILRSTAGTVISKPKSADGRSEMPFLQVGRSKFSVPGTRRVCKYHYLKSLRPSKVFFKLQGAEESIKRTKGILGPWTFGLRIEGVNRRLVTASWFEIWQVFNAIQAMCGRKSVPGFSLLHERLYIKLDAFPNIMHGNGTLLLTNETESVSLS